MRATGNGESIVTKKHCVLMIWFPWQTMKVSDSVPQTIGKEQALLCEFCQLSRYVIARLSHTFLLSHRFRGYAASMARCAEEYGQRHLQRKTANVKKAARET